MPNKKTESERLEVMFDALGESICNESDEEILDDIRQEGIDPEAEAARLRTMMLDTVKAFQQRRLIAAREGYRHRVEQLEKRKCPIRRALKSDGHSSRSSYNSRNTQVSLQLNTVSCRIRPTTTSKRILKISLNSASSTN